MISCGKNLDSFLLIILILDVGYILEASANPKSLSTHGDGATFPKRRVDTAVSQGGASWSEDKAQHLKT